MGLQEVRAFGKSRSEFWKNPPRGACGVEGCPEKDVILYAAPGEPIDAKPTMCASHYRARADRTRPYPCDNCGAEPAYRDPLHRRDEMFCQRCHEEMGYIAGERAMITKTAARVGVTHTLGRKAVCVLRGEGDCGGEVKQRGRHGEICNRHWNPKKYDANKGT